jgi:hypothetical protein
MFDIVVQLIMSIALAWMGLNLFLRPDSYKAFAASLDRFPSRYFARAPAWAVRGVGALLVLLGFFFFARMIINWH